MNVYVNDEDIRYLEKDRRRSRMATRSASCLPLPAAARRDRDAIRENAMATKIRNSATWQRQRSRVTLSKEEIQRYSRHLIMPEVGMEGQLKLKRAKVL